VASHMSNLLLNIFFKANLLLNIFFSLIEIEILSEPSHLIEIDVLSKPIKS